MGKLEDLINVIIPFLIPILYMVLKFRITTISEKV
jgi:hypothetical protein